MQEIKSYFSENFVIAQIADVNPMIHEEYRQVYARSVKLYQGVYNPVKILCLNTDQKPIDVTNSSIQFSLFEPNTECELFTVTATPVDTANGVVQINLTPGQIAALDFGSYEMAITNSDQNGNIYPCYVSDNYNARLNVDLLKGPIQGLMQAIPLSFTDIPSVGLISNQVNLTDRPITSTLLTLEANLQAYTGNIVALGSLVSQPTIGDFANISSTYYSNVSGFVMQNVIGTYAVIEFLLDSADPSGRTGNIFSNNFITNANIRF